MSAYVQLELEAPRRPIPVLSFGLATIFCRFEGGMSDVNGMIRGQSYDDSVVSTSYNLVSDRTSHRKTSQKVVKCRSPLRMSGCASLELYPLKQQTSVPSYGLATIFCRNEHISWKRRYVEMLFTPLSWGGMQEGY
jgi:hypothetical protein